MKTSALPPLRFDPKLRKAAESVLREGETLSAFVLDSVQANISQRQAQAQFLARGLAAEQRARRSGRYVSSAEVLRKIRSRITQTRSKQPQNLAR